MVTDDERRMVAGRLRGLTDSGNGVVWFLLEKHLGLVPDPNFLHGSVLTNESVARLADLIEPSCDREALLALADELRESLSWADANGDGRVTVPVRNLITVESRIRAACGEVGNEQTEDAETA